jgi:hypothetical protein
MQRERIPFNEWSWIRISSGRKFCTSRSHLYNDSRVIAVTTLPWGFIRDHLWMVVGANSPEELQRVINQIHRRIVPDDKQFIVHFGDFRIAAGGEVPKECDKK